MRTGASHNMPTMGSTGSHWEAVTCEATVSQTETASDTREDDLIERRRRTSATDPRA